MANEELKGTLRKWEDDRGFGFVEPEGGGDDVFVHISCFQRLDGRRPNVGDPIAYVLNFRSDRAKAFSARIDKNMVPKPSRIADGFALIAIVFFLAWIWGAIPIGPIFGGYLVMSVLTYAFYWADKRRAEAKRWRVTETALHVMEALGGWPGALVAQMALRHKNQKHDFQTVFWAIVAIHVVMWIWWIFLA
jgi:uncharacterized membrane protein YsdA (DUF1294 family)/cold shock CspA family protein